MSGYARDPRVATNLRGGFTVARGMSDFEVVCESGDWVIYQQVGLTSPWGRCLIGSGYASAEAAIRSVIGAPAG